MATDEEYPITHRVRIERDERPDLPDHEGHVPVVFLPFMNHGRYFMRTIGAEYLPDESDIDRALCHLGWEQTERWLNTFVAPGKVWRLDSQPHQDGYYVAVPTPEWVEAMTGGLVDAEAWFEEHVRDKRTELDDYHDGDVYGLIPERHEFWCPLDEDGDPDLDRGEHRWEEVADGSVWGYYGRGYAIEAAKTDVMPDGIDFYITEGDEVLEEVRHDGAADHE